MLSQVSSGVAWKASSCKRSMPLSCSSWDRKGIVAHAAGSQDASDRRLLPMRVITLIDSPSLGRGLGVSKLANSLVEFLNTWVAPPLPIFIGARSGIPMPAVDLPSYTF